MKDLSKMTYNHSELKLFHVFFIMISDNELVFKKILFASFSVQYGCPGYYGIKIHNNNKTIMYFVQSTLLYYYYYYYYYYLYNIIIIISINCNMLGVVIFHWIFH